MLPSPRHPRLGGFRLRRLFGGPWLAGKPRLLLCMSSILRAWTPGAAVPRNSQGRQQVICARTASQAVGPSVMSTAPIEKRWGHVDACGSPDAARTPPAKLSLLSSDGIYGCVSFCSQQGRTWNQSPGDFCLFFTKRLSCWGSLVMQGIAPNHAMVALFRWHSYILHLSPLFVFLRVLADLDPVTGCPPNVSPVSPFSSSQFVVADSDLVTFVLPTLLVFADSDLHTASLSTCLLASGSDLVLVVFIWVFPFFTLGPCARKSSYHSCFLLVSLGPFRRQRDLTTIARCLSECSSFFAPH